MPACECPRRRRTLIPCVNMNPDHRGKGCWRRATGPGWCTWKVLSRGTGPGSRWSSRKGMEVSCETLSPLLRWPPTDRSTKVFCRLVSPCSSVRTETEPLRTWFQQEVMESTFLYFQIKCFTVCDLSILCLVGGRCVCGRGVNRRVQNTPNNMAYEPDMKINVKPTN